MSKVYFPAGVLALLVLTGCASERVVLLPSADGQRSAVVVSDAKGKVVLDQPYAATLRRGSSTQAYQSSAAEVAERFADALAAQPMRPSSYMLYFEPGGNVLTAASQADMLRIRSEIGQRAAAEIMVIGHTDRVGDSKSNDALSKQRAVAMRAVLIEAGIPADRLEAVGRGERDPLVPTADDVAEPKNRRVEINLR
jgi:outer membrane protein OmpA-like peptidoglycan-associated protein